MLRATEPVFDDERRLLADVRLVPENAHRDVWAIEPVAAAPFLDYYFRGGGVIVWLGAGDRAARGTLMTSWAEGRRVWHVKICAGAAYDQFTAGDASREDAALQTRV